MHLWLKWVGDLGLLMLLASLGIFAVCAIGGHRREKRAFREWVERVEGRGETVFPHQEL